MSSGRPAAGRAKAAAQTHPQASVLLGIVQGPLRGVRAFCLDCLGACAGMACEAKVSEAEASVVESCEDRACPLHGVRLKALHAPAGRPAPRADLHLLLRACRRQCLQCAGDPAAVRSCDANGACALWEWRFGVFPQTYASVTRRFAARLAGELAASPDGPLSEAASGTDADAACVCAPRQDPGAALSSRPKPSRKAPCLSASARSQSGRRQSGRDLLTICGLK